MSAKKVYTCNICGVSNQLLDQIAGIKFTGQSEFEIDEPRTTDGTHICKKCLKQLKNQLKDMKI